MNLKIDVRRSLADKCGIGDDYLYQLLTRRKVCSPELCVTLEKNSGGAVRRWDLRPDDWHLIWPELIGADGAPEIQVKAA